MGKSNIIKYLSSCSTSYKTGCIKPKTVGYLNSKIIAIDLYQIIYKFLHNERRHYLVSLVNFIKYLHCNNIKPIFVIDGKPPREKSDVLKKRRNKKMQSLKIVDDNKKSIEKIEKIINTTSINDTIKMEELSKEKEVMLKNIKKYQKRTVKVSKNIINNIKNVFDLYEMPYIHIPDKEADYICAQLVIHNVANVCLSDDNDLIAFQCPSIIQNFNMATDTFDMCHTHYIGKCLNLTRDQLTDLIILNGTDYQSKRHPYEFKYIHNLILSDTSLDNILKELHFGKNEYKSVLDIYTQTYDKNVLINNIKHYKNINKSKRFIDNSKIKVFCNDIHTRCEISMKDSYHLKEALESVFSTINISSAYY